MNRKSYYTNTFRDELRKKINLITGQVFSRNDLTQDHSNQTQLKLNRALHAFIDEGIIIKIAHGLFAKATSMRIPGRGIQAALIEPFESVVTEALDKLRVKWELGSAIRDYNAGKTTQIPVVFSVRLKSRFRGSIHAEGRKLIFEGGINAR